MSFPAARHTLPDVAPPEVKVPVLFHAPTRKSVACFGAVILSSGKFVRALCERFDALTFESFMKKCCSTARAASAWSWCWTMPDTTTPCYWRLGCGDTTKC